MISFPPASPDDLELLVSLVRDLRADDPEEGPFNESATRAALPAILSDPSFGRIWLIRSDEQIVGYVALLFAFSIEFGGRIAFVDELFIRPMHRRRGLATTAMQFVETESAKLNIRALLLEVTRSNAAAKTLYERAGFRDRPMRTMFKRIGSATDPS